MVFCGAAFALLLVVIAISTVGVHVMRTRLNAVDAERMATSAKTQEEQARNRKFERDMQRKLDENSGVLWPPEVLEEFEELAATDGKLFSARLQLALAIAIAEQHQLRREDIRKKREANEKTAD